MHNNVYASVVGAAMPASNGQHAHRRRLAASCRGACFDLGGNGRLGHRGLARLASVQLLWHIR
jgi:hypothetical protein